VHDAAGHVKKYKKFYFEIPHYAWSLPLYSYSKIAKSKFVQNLVKITEPINC